MTTKSLLNTYRESIPFLQHIPDEVYFALDPSEWFLPREEIERKRKQLEQDIGHYVMTYQHNVFRKDIPLEKHLCSNIEGAQLSDNQAQLLKEAEKSCSVSFVVYKKPLAFIVPEKSPLVIAY